MNNNIKYSHIFEIYRDGKVDLIQKELRKGLIDPLNAMIMFASWGYLEGIEEVNRFQSLQEYPMVFYLAAQGNHFDCIKFLNQNHYQYDSRTILAATENQNLEMIKFLLEKKDSNFLKSEDLKINLEVTAKNGNLEILEFWVKQLEEKQKTSKILNIFEKSKILEIAGKNGHLDSLKFLLDHDFIPSENLIINLLRSGQENCAIYLYSHGFQPDYSNQYLQFKLKKISLS